MNAFSAVALRLGDSAWWVLSAQGCPETLDPDSGDFPEIRPGIKGHPTEDGAGLPPISFREAGDGRRILQLLETRRYEWDIVGADAASVASSLELLGGQWQTRRLRSLGGSFSIVNHLGVADFEIRAPGIRQRFDLEIVSNKLAYHSEFRQITEDIADFCQQLLLNWDTPTSLTFTADPENSARLQLERFLFLRAALTSERLEEIMEAINRRPHSRLVHEREWTPLAIAGSSDWIQQPASMARDWRRMPNGQALPGQILDVRKLDSADTPPNRFLKHALVSFRDLCHEVIDHHPKALSLVREARDLGDSLDSILARPFFHDIGRMTRLPLESPVLQQRSGYRDLLRVWLLTESAAALSWDRDDDSYHGPTRNVATLYEYWIFLQLHQLLDEIEGVTRDTGNPKPCDDADAFLTTQKGELIINLKRGKKTCAPFTCTLPGGRVLKVHLYYERVFQWDQQADAPASYSRQFKPDYTLAIFPERFATEADASESGKVAYVHFDAKYRAENLKAIFGETDEDLDAEKQQAKATATYKRGDLLKMHTYNDAV